MSDNLFGMLDMDDVSEDFGIKPNNRYDFKVTKSEWFQKDADQPKKWLLEMTCETEGPEFGKKEAVFLRPVTLPEGCTSIKDVTDPNDIKRINNNATRLFKYMSGFGIPKDQMPNFQPEDVLGLEVSAQFAAWINNGGYRNIEFRDIRLRNQPEGGLNAFASPFGG